MTTRSRLSSGVRTLLGGPSDDPLENGGVPEHLIFEVLHDTESSMLVDLELSDQNRRVSKKVVTLSPNEFDFAVNASDYVAPVFAHLQTSPADSTRWPVDIINLASVDQYGVYDKLGVAFYGTPPRARLSWIPQSGEKHTLTVWYDKSAAADGGMDEESDIFDPYTTHLKLQAVAQLMEWMGKTVGDVLKARIAKGERQWQKHVRSNRQQGLVSKPSSHPRAGQRGWGRFQRPGGGYI